MSHRSLNKHSVALSGEKNVQDFMEIFHMGESTAEAADKLSQVKFTTQLQRPSQSYSRARLIALGRQGTFCKGQVRGATPGAEAAALFSEDRRAGSEGFIFSQHASLPRKLSTGTPPRSHRSSFTQ